MFEWRLTCLPAQDVRRRLEVARWIKMKELKASTLMLQLRNLKTNKQALHSAWSQGCGIKVWVTAKLRSRLDKVLNCRSQKLLGKLWLVHIISLPQRALLYKGWFCISMFHRAFFNSITNKTPTHALFIQHYISLEQRFSNFWCMISFDRGSASKVDDVTALPSRHKMADMCYYGNVMTTRWRICVTMATLWQQQDGGYVLLVYWVCYRCILHLQQYSHRPNLFSYFNSVSFHFSPTRFQPTFPTILTQLPECLNCLGQAVSPGGRHFSGGLICGVHVCMYVRMCVFEYPVESANI